MDFQENLNYDPKVNDFMRMYRGTGKIPSLDAQEWFLLNKGLPKRTFQFYMNEKFFPAPKLVEGRNHFYTGDEFLILTDLIDVFRELKKSSKVRFGVIKKILRKKHCDLRGVTDKLLTMVEQFPVHVRKFKRAGSKHLDALYYSPKNDYVWSETIARLEEGVRDLNSIRMTEFEEEYEAREQAAKALAQREG